MHLYRWFLFREIPNKDPILLDESIGIFTTFALAQHCAEARLQEEFWEPFEHKYYIVDNKDRVFNDLGGEVIDDVDFGFATTGSEAMKKKFMGTSTMCTIHGRRKRLVKFLCCLCPC